MKKSYLRYIYMSGAAAVIAAAAIAIPAFGASGGSDSSGAQGQSGRAPLPVPPQSGAEFRAQAPSAAEIKESRAKLDDYANCLRDNGIDVPAPPDSSDGSSSQPPAPPSRAEMEKGTDACGTPPAPPAGLLPPPGSKQADQGSKHECPPLPPPPAPSSGSNSGS